MSRVRTAVAAFVVVASLLALPAASATATSPTIEMIQKVNAYRAEHGVGPVRVSRSLMYSAGWYSSYMMSHGYFGHLDRIHASHHFRALGEILEYHPGDAAKVNATFSDWIHSSEHRSIILDSMFRYAGAGFTEGRFDGRRATLWVMHFGG